MTAKQSHASNICVKQSYSINSPPTFMTRCFLATISPHHQQTYYFQEEEKECRTKIGELGENVLYKTILYLFNYKQKQFVLTLQAVLANDLLISPVHAKIGILLFGGLLFLYTLIVHLQFSVAHLQDIVPKRGWGEIELQMQNEESQIRAYAQKHTIVVECL